MQKYIKNFLKDRGLDETDFIPCEVCGATSSDIHHIIFKSQRGTDDASNLIALCRLCHNIAHGKVEGQGLTRKYLLGIVKQNNLTKHK